MGVRLCQCTNRAGDIADIQQCDDKDNCIDCCKSKGYYTSKNKGIKSESVTEIIHGTDGTGGIKPTKDGSTATTKTNERKTPWWMWLIVIAVILGIIAGVIYILKKKKKA